MTKKELEDLKIGDVVRTRRYETLTVKSIKITNEQDKESVELTCQSLDGIVRKGEYKKFIIPKRFIRIDRVSGEKATTSLQEILNEDGLYSYSMTGTVEEALYNGEKVYSPDAIFRWV